MNCKLRHRSTELQTMTLDYWNLELGILSELGAWCLEFSRRYLQNETLASREQAAA
jgi:hypothetical protein